VRINHSQDDLLVIWTRRLEAILGSVYPLQISPVSSGPIGRRDVGISSIEPPPIGGGHNVVAICARVLEKAICQLDEVDPAASGRENSGRWIDLERELRAICRGIRDWPYSELLNGLAVLDRSLGPDGRERHGSIHYWGYYIEKIDADRGAIDSVQAEAAKDYGERVKAGL
jgi:hypothetical protein